jgi:hypothetical protein
MSGEKCMECQNEFNDTSVREDKRFKIDFPQYEKMDVHICSECGNKRRYEKKVEEFNKVITAFADMANSSTLDYKGLESDAVVEAFLRQHRHLQGSMVTFLRTILRKLGEKAGNSMHEDGRNAGALEWCKKISEV